MAAAIAARRDAVQPEVAGAAGSRCGNPGYHLTTAGLFWSNSSRQPGLSSKMETAGWKPPHRNAAPPACCVAVLPACQFLIQCSQSRDPIRNPPLSQSAPASARRSSPEIAAPAAAIPPPAPPPSPRRDTESPASPAGDFPALLWHKHGSSPAAPRWFTAGSVEHGRQCRGDHWGETTGIPGGCPGWRRHAPAGARPSPRPDRPAPSTAPLFDSVREKCRPGHSSAAMPSGSDIPICRELD